MTGSEVIGEITARGLADEIPPDLLPVEPMLVPLDRRLPDGRSRGPIVAAAAIAVLGIGSVIAVGNREARSGSAPAAPPDDVEVRELDLDNPPGPAVLLHASRTASRTTG
jgi:hypothetical protein